MTERMEAHAPHGTCSGFGMHARGSAGLVFERHTGAEAPPVLAADDLSLLGSFADGPRIWDAVVVFERVLRLELAGLVERDGEVGRYRLTAAGRQALDARQVAPQQ